MLPAAGRSAGRGRNWLRGNTSRIYLEWHDLLSIPRSAPTTDRHEVQPETDKAAPDHNFNNAPGPLIGTHTAAEVWPVRKPAEDPAPLANTGQPKAEFDIRLDLRGPGESGRCECRLRCTAR